MSANIIFSTSPSLKPLVKCIIYSLRILAPLEKCPLVKEQSASGHLSDLTVFWSLVVHTVTMVCSKWFMVMQIQLSGKRVGTAPKTYGRTETDSPESGSLCWSSWKQAGQRDGLIERGSFSRGNSSICKLLYIRLYMIAETREDFLQMSSG